MSFRKILSLIIAFIAFGLGTAGIFLPILPTVPLYLLAAFCFANSSERLHHWFLGTGLYKRHLLPYLKAGGVTRMAKIYLILGVSLQIGVAAFLVRNSLVGLVILGILYFGFLISMLFVVKTVLPQAKPPKASKRERQVNSVERG